MNKKDIITWSLIASLLGTTMHACTSGNRKTDKINNADSLESTTEGEAKNPEKIVLEQLKEPAEFAVNYWTDYFNKAQQNPYGSLKELFNKSTDFLNSGNLTKAKEYSLKALELIDKFNLRPPYLLQDQQYLEDDFHCRLGNINARTGKTQEMFEHYFKALVLSIKNQDQGVKNYTGDVLYNVSKVHSKKYIVQQELSKLTGYEQKLIKKDLAFRVVRAYIGEQHIEDMKDIIRRVKTVAALYGLANKELIDEAVKEYFVLSGEGIPKQKNKAIALRGYEDSPIIRLINSAIKAQ